MSDVVPVKIETNTEVKVINLSHTWKIRNFSFCDLKTGQCLTSSTFSANAKNNSKWHLTLYPNGSTKEDKEYISVFLRLESCNEESVFVKFKLSFWNAKLAKFVPIGPKEFESLRFLNNSDDNRDFGSRKFHKKNPILNAANGLIVDDELILHCEMKEAVETVNISINYYESNEDELQVNLADHLELMFNQEKFSDVTLLVGDRNFSAHKSILAARSPVFAAMFEHDMMERRKNKVVIKDADPEVMKEMLIFIYTDKSPNLETMAEDLLVAADKYDLRKLKSICEQVLCAKVTSENAAKILSLADRHKAEKLRSWASMFISIRATDLMKTLSWTNMLSENSDLVSEAIAATTSCPDAQ